jgi:hypothetical protein
MTNATNLKRELDLGKIRHILLCFLFFNKTEEQNLKRHG